MFEQSKANLRHLDAAVPVNLPNREKAIRLWPMKMVVSRMRGGKRYPLSPSLQFATPPGMAFDTLGDLESISEAAASWALEATTRQ